MRIDCHVPITLRIVGVPTDDQLAAVGAALARTVAARLAEARRLLAERHGGYGAATVEVREWYAAGRDDVEGYAVPSYGHEGAPVAIPNRKGAPAPATSRPAARRDPTNPNNTLSADELYKIWQEYWVTRHLRAGAHEYALRTSLEKLDPVGYRQARERFDLGLVDALGAQYAAANAELDLCRTMTDLQPEVQEWLWAKRILGPVTFPEVNIAALDTARGRAWRAAYATPIALGFLGLVGPRPAVNRLDVGELPTVPEIPGEPSAAAQSDPAGTSPPRSLGRGTLAGTIRNLTARAMIGLAEAEPATRLPTGSPTVTERSLPTATAPPSAPARPAATAPAGPAVADLSEARPGVGTSARPTGPDSAGQPRRSLGDADDAALNRAFDLSPSPATIAPGQGVVTVAPEVAAGVTPAQIQALRRVLGQSLGDPALSVLAADWDAAARAGDPAILTAANSRYLFGLHRDRFWRRVAANPAAVTLLRDAGMAVEGGAPYLTLNGQRVTVTIDHITERQTAPHLTLTAANLRLSLSRENSVLLRLLHELDPFQ